MGWLAATDRGWSLSRPAWGWLGEVGLVVLGVHLAADRADDVVGQLIEQSPWWSPEMELPIGAIRWSVIGVELLVLLWALQTRFRAREIPAWVPAKERAIPAVEALCFGIIATAGCYHLGIAVEDATALAWPDGAPVLGALVAVAALVRLAATATWAIARRKPGGGAWGVLAMAPVAGWVLRGAWPVWGLASSSPAWGWATMAWSWVRATAGIP